MTNLLSFNKQVDFWDSVINPDNITKGEISFDNFNLKENLDFYFTPIQEYAYMLMGNIEGKKILELGCGLGLNAVIMAQKGAYVTAIDASPKRVQWVKKIAERYRLENITAICMSAEDLEFENESFDIIYSNEVLIHLNRLKVLDSCAHILCKGGKAIFIESLKSNPFVNLYRNTFGPKIFKHIADHLSLKEIDVFKSYFIDVNHKEFYLFSFMAFFWQFGIRNLRLFKFSVRILNRVDSFIFSYFPSMRFLGWMTCIKCTK